MARSFRCWFTLTAVAVSISLAGGQYDSRLPKVGSKAPDFTLKQPSGKSLSLLKEARKYKVTVVNFWFYG